MFDKDVQLFENNIIIWFESYDMVDPLVIGMETPRIDSESSLVK